MRRVLIAGIGNVLLGDDGIGPFVIKLLECQYVFPEMVELADLGTPALDLPVHLAGADAVILIDSARFGGVAGEVRLFRKEELLQIPAGTRIDPHSPSLRESLSQLELIETIPGDLMLIGVQGKQFELGSKLSKPVRDRIPYVVDEVLRELHRLNVGYEWKPSAAPPAIWWQHTGTKVNQCV